MEPSLGPHGGRWGCAQWEAGLQAVMVCMSLDGRRVETFGDKDAGLSEWGEVRGKVLEVGGVYGKALDQPSWGITRH